MSLALRCAIVLALMLVRYRSRQDDAALLDLAWSVPAA